jgi:hypothetical protein
VRKKVRIVGEKFSALFRLLQNVETCIFSLTILYYFPNLYFFYVWSCYGGFNSVYSTWKSEMPFSKKIPFYDTVRLLLESNALSGHHQIYWFCRQCWQTMDIYNLNRCSSSPSLTLVRELGLKKQHSLSVGFNSSI